MDLKKIIENVGIKKNLFNFLHKTNFNTELQDSHLMNWTNTICLHICLI